MAGKVVLIFTLWALFGLIVRMAITTLAAEPATSAFGQTWARTDDPVALGLVERTWMWGPEGFTEAMTEDYADAPGGERTVQYFDKTRMEENGYRASAPWDVTNGLLVVELITGNMQVGDDDFIQHAPAEVNVAGDQDVEGVTYADIASLRDAPALPDGAAITQRLDVDGNVTDDPLLAGYGVTAAYRVSVPGIDHQVASPFWAFMNSSGTVHESGAYVDATLFLNAFYATGFPLTEAYWAEVKVAGTYQDVLLQCFERRCLTYTPGNPEGWQVEAGNVGLHYYEWRYGQIDDEQPGDEPGDEQPAPAPTATATEPGDGTPPEDEPTPSPTATDPDDEPEEPAPEKYNYAGQFGGPDDPDSAFDAPIGVGVGPDGFVYVLEGGTDRVQKFTGRGVRVASWGETGSGAGQFKDPTSVAFDDAGRVYITDWDNSRVLVFDGAGNQLDQIGSYGNNDGQFGTPGGVAIDSAGYIYVTDTNAHRIQKFDRSGAFVAKWGTFGSDPDQLYLPYGIAIDRNDRIYVTDSGNERVQVFDTAGNVLDSWGGVEGSGPGEFDDPFGIAVSANGTVYVADYLNHRIQAFDTDGNYLGKWGKSGAGPGEFTYPEGIAVDGAGNVYVVDANNRVQKFNRTGDYLTSWADGNSGRLVAFTPAMTLDADGNVYIADHIYDRIQVFDADGDFIRQLGITDLGIGSPGAVLDIAVSADGYVYAADAEEARVLKFRRDGTFITAWDSGLTEPTALAVDEDGAVYVGDNGSNEVLVFDESGSLLRSWGGPGSGAGQFNGPIDIAVHNGRVYVSDHYNNRVQYFDLTGAYLGQWGGAGSGEGQLDGPAGITIDARGFVYVTETNNHRVQKFTADGEYMTQFGSRGSGAGSFDQPARIEVDRTGSTVYVLDMGNQRVQIFERLGAPV